MCLCPGLEDCDPTCKFSEVTAVANYKLILGKKLILRKVYKHSITEAKQACKHRESLLYANRANLLA